jgi:hypothetical protein
VSKPDKHDLDHLHRRMDRAQPRLWLRDVFQAAAAEAATANIGPHAEGKPLMSALSRFMTTTRNIRDEQDRKAARTDQPPFFVRTTWMFAELEELSLLGEANIFAAMKIARLRQNVAGIGKLVDLIIANNEILTDGRQRHERRQLCAWIKEQIAREPKP